MGRKAFRVTGVEVVGGYHVCLVLSASKMAILLQFNFM
jgi:hypothetical protein